MRVGDIVEYTEDWKPNRQWYLYKINENTCTIVLIRNGEYKTIRNQEAMLNANIRNLDIKKIKPFKFNCLF